MIGKIVVGALVITALGGGAFVAGTAQLGADVVREVWNGAEFDGDQTYTDPTPGTSKTPVTAYARACPLIDAYFSVDAVAQRAIAPGLTALAESEAASSDPAVRAFATTILPALAKNNGAAREQARSLLARECANAGHALS